MGIALAESKRFDENVAHDVEVFNDDEHMMKSSCQVVQRWIWGQRASKDVPMWMEMYSRRETKESEYRIKFTLIKRQTKQTDEPIKRELH